VGSALAAAVLAAFTRHGERSPAVGGFEMALLIASGLCALTAVLGYVLPGRGAGRPTATTTQAVHETAAHETEAVTDENAELGIATVTLSPDTTPRARKRR
jgi:hypothetical protein